MSSFELQVATHFFIVHLHHFGIFSGENQHVYCCEIVSKEKKSNGEISNSRYFIAKGGRGGGKPISRPKYGYHGQTYEAKFDHIHMNIFQTYDINKST